MSLVVANASSGPTTITLSAITVSGIVTVKDSGSASGTNTVTIQAAAGNTFESGLTSYTLTTASAYISFVGNASTLKWRVLGSTYADTPVVSPVPSPPALGGNLSATLSNLSVISQAAFYSSVQIQGSLSVFSSITARNINFTGILTSNGNTFSGAPAGINSAGSIGINSASNASYSLLVTGNQSNTGTLGVAGATTLVNSSNTGTLGVAGATILGGTLNAAGGFTGRFNTDTWINSIDGRARILYYSNSSSVYGTGDRHYFRNNADANVFDISSTGAGVFTGTLVSLAGFAGKFARGQWITSADDVPRLYFAENSDTLFYTAANSTFYFQSPAGNVANINGNSGSYTQMSDQRIKKNILITRDSLDIINQINIVSYDYIDSARGSVKHGIVAQQLQQVYPDAVDTLRNVIPSHLTVVDFDLESENILIKCSTPHELVVNDTVKLDIDNKRLDKVILEVPSDTTFIVSAWDNFSTTSSVSLYGKYVNDFLSYDKSQIGVLAAGACQTLSGQVSTLQAESLTYSSTISTLQSDSEVKASTITALQSTLDSQQSTITSILTKLST